MNIPDRKKEYRFALVGNPNCGKTTLFNTLTGNHRKVGNRAGVTVDCKEGIYRRAGDTVRITDLPGTYSLAPDSADEAVAYDYIVNEKPDVIINIIDATNLERNLYLTLRLTQIGVPVIAALNMADVLEKNGTVIDTKILEKELGIKAVPICAYSGRGTHALITAAKQLASNNTLSPVRQDLYTSQGVYDFISDIAERAVKKRGTDRQSQITERIDSLALNPILSIPIFFLAMLLIFQITFGRFGTFLSDCVDTLINEKLADCVFILLKAHGAPPFITSLVTDGILTGVGSVGAFFPQIMLLFLLLSLLEDCGYTARTAFIMDRLFSKFGLSGKSFIPMIMGFGCSVPAVMSARTLESARDRRITALLIPFMSCGAKMPVYAVFTGVLFENNGAAVIFSLYILGVILAAISGIILGKTVLRGSAAPFVLELPPYRVPTFKAAVYHMLEKVKEFAVRAGTLLIPASVALWFLRSFDFRLIWVYDSADSMMGIIGKALAPLTTPCGFGSWQTSAALLSGVAAKESIVCALGILYSARDTQTLSHILASVFTPLKAYSFLVFVLLYTPCTAAIAVIKSELGSWKWAAVSVCWQLGAAWLVSAAVFGIGRAAGLN